MSNADLPLNSLQSWMHNALVFPGRATREEVEEIVESSPRLTGLQRLAIYQRSYSLRLLRCMSEQFPALRHALGEDLFIDFARQYLQAHPPVTYTLYDLGRRFPTYLEATRPDHDADEAHREKWIDFMVDLARFERQLFVLFDAPGNEERPLADDTVPDSRLRLQPCFALGDYRFPVASYYHAIRIQNNPAFPPPQRSLVASVRKDYLTHTLPINESHFTFLTALISGKPVIEALQVVAHVLAIPIDQLLQSWTAPNGVRQRWIAAGFFIDADRIASLHDVGTSS